MYVYVWLTSLGLLEVWPSPKFQSHDVGVPVEVPLKLTVRVVWFLAPLVGDPEKLNVGFTQVGDGDGEVVGDADGTTGLGSCCWSAIAVDDSRTVLEPRTAWSIGVRRLNRAVTATDARVPSNGAAGHAVGAPDAS